MGTGILVCGLNGAGKSTLGLELANNLGFYFIDNEYLFFNRTSNNEPYTNPRSHEEAVELLMTEVQNNPNFVFSAVRGDYGKDIISMYDFVVLIEAPAEVRLQRIRNRSHSKFGDRMLEEGDLFEQEEAFFRFAESRSSDYVEQWLETLNCPILRVDGTKPIKESIDCILKNIGDYRS